jgi:tricarboxylate carrier
MLYAFNPLLLLNTNQACSAAQTEIETLRARHEAGEKLYFSVSENARLWRAKQMVDAAIHPDTGEFIPRPFRMSGYVPFNGPVAVAMVTSTATPALLFWHWANQSQNALVNFYNRNASSPMSNETLATSYGGAVTAALTMAFGLSTFINRRFEPARAKQLLRFVAFPTAVTASSLNCYIVRRPEIADGYKLLDEHSHCICDTKSSVAAKQGVLETTMSRALLQCPVYFLPPALMTTVPMLKRMAIRNPASVLPVTTYLLLIAFGFGLPAACAVFPRMSSINTEDLEPEVRLHLKGTGSEGKLPDRVFFNRGV